jgi:hypothetical protein
VDASGRLGASKGGEEMKRVRTGTWLQLGTALIALSLGVAHAQALAPVPAALGSLSPTGVERGRTIDLVFSGVNLSDAREVVFDDPAITGTLRAGANRGQAVVAATIGPEARVGVHRGYLVTPLGVTGAVPFVVGAWPERPEAEPNDLAEAAPLVSLPATLTGAMGKPGDRDCCRFTAKAGEELVFELLAPEIRSRLNPVVTLLDDSGNLLREARVGAGRTDVVLGYRFEREATYAIEIRDFENQAGGDVNYRLNAGAFPLVTERFPLAAPPSGGRIALSGFNLGGATSLELSEETVAGKDAVTVGTVNGRALLRPLRIPITAEPVVTEAAAPHAAPATAQAMSCPGAVDGRITAADAAGGDLYRFHAQKGQELVLEVLARRAGSPLDPVVEVLDASGRRIERAALRCVAQTIMTLRDHDAVSPGIRLAAWNELALNDYLYADGELIRVAGLPLGPDADVAFRSVRGQRQGFLGTTPVAHAINAPIYKVQIHPPGKSFPPNGMPVFRLRYRNDDGGPLYGRDSHLTFTAPADGDYLVRIADARGQGGDRYAYRLAVREPRPDFRLSLSPEHPNVPAGRSVPVTVSVDRLDGFEGRIDVRAEGLPEGLIATPTQIEAGETSAVLMLTGALGAKTPVFEGRSSIRVVGIGKGAQGELVRAVEPHEGRRYVTVLPDADLSVAAGVETVALRPGEERRVSVSITRRNGFGGRVPVQVRNLPFGVRVLDVGLNGVLITEGESIREFTLVCEPWVQPTERLIYCTASTETSAPEVAVPVLLRVLPAAQR